MCLDIQAHTIKMYIQGLFLTDIPETHFKAVNTELEGRRDHAVSLYCFPAPHPSQQNLNKFDDFYLFFGFRHQSSVLPHDFFRGPSPARLRQGFPGRPPPAGLPPPG
jgi:hypothetical protein